MNCEAKSRKSLLFRRSRANVSLQPTRATARYHTTSNRQTATTCHNTPAKDARRTSACSSRRPATSPSPFTRHSSSPLSVKRGGQQKKAFPKPHRKGLHLLFIYRVALSYTPLYRRMRIWLSPAWRTSSPSNPSGITGETLASSSQMQSAPSLSQPPATALDRAFSPSSLR